jgi:putative PIN family toxin of toxin-antitoxin system
MQPNQSEAWVVIDTNVALDLWVFKDTRTEDLKNALDKKTLNWIATAAMREELKRVLDYPHIKLRVLKMQKSLGDLMANFDALVDIKADVPKCKFTCKDPDDQKFIDLAVFYSSELISKDKCVLTMKNRLQRLGVVVHSQWPQKSS